MAVTIVIPTPLRQFAGGKSEIEVEAATAGAAPRQSKLCKKQATTGD